MMDFRQRLEQNRSTPANSEIAAEPDDYFSCPYYATERVNSPVCLDLRLPNGKRKALPYCYFTEITYEIDAGIEIVTTSKTIMIIGRHLTKLFEHLITYRVRYIQANIGSDPGEDGLFVKEIVITPLDA